MRTTRRPGNEPSPAGDRRRRRPRLGAVLAVALVIAAPVPAAAQAPAADAGSIGIRLVDVPESGRDDARAHVYIVDHLAPGTTIRRRVEVANTTAATSPVTVYAAAAAIDKGSFHGAEGHTANDLSSWTSVEPPAAEVAAGGRLMVTVTVAVPADAVPGEHYAAVWAEARSAAPAAGGVTQVSRVGIRMYLSVGPGGAGAPDFVVDSLTASRGADGRPAVTAAVHNTGQRALDMTGALALSGGAGGLSAGPFPATLGVTLAVGATEPVVVQLDPQVPAGPWDARLVLKSGRIERAAEAAITFPASGSAAPVPPAGTSFPWPYAAGAVLAGATIVVGWAGVLRRRQLRRSPATLGA